MKFRCGPRWHGSFGGDGRRVAALDFFGDVGDYVHKGGTVPGSRRLVWDFLVFLLCFVLGLCASLMSLGHSVVA
jgi:hypothetical protein